MNRDTNENLNRQYLRHARNGNLEGVKDCLARGACSDYHDKGLKTALHNACAGGDHVDVVKYLLDHTALKINVKRRDGSTPLYSACQRNHRRVVEYLVLKAHDDLESSNENGWTPLSRAFHSGHVDLTLWMIREARKQQGNATGTALVGLKTFQQICQVLTQPGFQPWHDNRPNLDTWCQFWVDQAKIHPLAVSPETGSTAIHVAYQYNRLQVADWLVRWVQQDQKNHHEAETTSLSKNGLGNTTPTPIASMLLDAHGNTLAHSACLGGGSLELVVELLRRPDLVSGGIEQPNFKGETLLHCAIKGKGYCSPRIVEWLLQPASGFSAASLLAQNKQGQTVLDVAKQLPDETLYQKLMAVQAQRNWDLVQSFAIPKGIALSSKPHS